MNQAESRNVGAYLAVRSACAATSVTAGGSGDATEITGTTIDRLALGNLYQSAVIVVRFHEDGAGLANNETAKVSLNIEHSDDSFSTTADYTVPDFASTTIASAETVVTGTGGVDLGTKAYAVDLSQAKRYIRLMATPNLSAGSTDVMYFEALWVFGGPNEAPVDNLNP